MKKYQAIVFDFGNIFMKLDYPKCFSSFSKLLGFDFHVDTIPESLMKVLNRHEKGEVTDEEWIWAFQNIEPSLQPRDIIDAWNDLLVGMQAHHFDFLLELRKEYKLFLLSNINAPHERWIDRYLKKEYEVEDFKREYFDGFYYTHYMGKRKPDDEVYEYVAQSLQEQGVDQFLFIDDKMENIEAARRNGWSVAWHDENADIAEKLESYINLKQE